MCSMVQRRVRLVQRLGEFLMIMSQTRCRAFLLQCGTLHNCSCHSLSIVSGSKLWKGTHIYQSISDYENAKQYKREGGRQPHTGDNGNVESTVNKPAYNGVQYSKRKVNPWKERNNYIVPMPTLNASEIDSTCSLFILHCSFECFISQANLFSALQWQHDPFLPHERIYHNDSRH
jgi:hypothetical protein